MAEDDKESAKEAYLRGRLLGLNELIRVLKETLSSGEGELSKSIVEHVSNEMEEIIDELRGVAPKADIRKIEEKHEELKKASEKTPELNKENVRKADDLMKSLMDLQK